MISSAVIIPEDQPVLRPPTSPSLKRRQSSLETDADSNATKRLRTETAESPESAARDGLGRAAEPSSPTHRRSSALGNGVAEERKRGQRLFGALLGTLSQKSSKPVHKRRDEIEQRQRERLRKDNEVREAEVRQKQEELNEIRMVEQKAWDRTSAQLRHRNMRAVANFLQTKTEPRLYYRPWDLRLEEEEQIKRQIQEVEEVVQGERREHGEENDEVEDARRDSGTISTAQDDDDHITGPNHVNDSDKGGILTTPEETTSSSGNKKDHNNDNSDIDNDNDNEKDEVKEATQVVVSPDSTNQATLSENEVNDNTSSSVNKLEISKEEDHEGEELVEGQEDDVMY